MRISLKKILSVLAVCVLAIIVALPASAMQPAKKVYPRGHKMPPKHTSTARHKVSNAKYANHLNKLPVATQAAYDAYTATGGSCVPPIGDQGQCGDCYQWSGMKVASSALMTAGLAPKDGKFMLSVQWSLDYHPELGGCDGGDEYQVTQVVQSEGAPSVTDYPGAGQGAGSRKPMAGIKTYTVSSIVYCDPTQTDQGVASTQSIKNCILAYGYVSVAVAAGSGDWDNYRGGTLTGRSTDIDHAVGLTAWDDTHDNGDGTKGAWQVDNQWGTSWGNNGRAWIKYGADSIGTEAYVALVNTPTPVPPVPVPPTPDPTPTPVPPTPTPVPVPVPTVGFSGTITYANGVLVSIVPSNGPSPTPVPTPMPPSPQPEPQPVGPINPSCPNGVCQPVQRQGLFGGFFRRR